MGNLIWNLIIYGVTFGIVFICFRAFVEDRKESEQNATQLLVERTNRRDEDDNQPGIRFSGPERRVFPQA